MRPRRQRRALHLTENGNYVMQDKKIKILHCTKALTFGGELTILRRTIPYLDPERFDNIVCGIRSRADEVGEFADLGVPVFALNAGSRVNVLKGALAVARLIRREKVDLIHTQVFGNEREVHLASIFTRTPVVGSLTTTFDPRLQAGGSRMREYRGRATMAVTSALGKLAGASYIAPTEWVAESAVKHLRIDRKRITIAPWGIEPAPAENAGRDRAAVLRLRAGLGLDGAHPVLLNVGRLTAVKGQADLLRAMRHIVDALPSARLLIAGDGELNDELAGLIETLGLAEHVHLLGRRDDVTNLLRLSDIFVFGSHYEGLPHSVLEAMEAAMPIVAFDVPPLAEILSDPDSGLVVSPREPPEFARAVIRLAGDPALAEQLARQAHATVMERFDARKNAVLLEDVYDRIMWTAHPARNEAA